MGVYVCSYLFDGLNQSIDSLEDVFNATWVTSYGFEFWAEDIVEFFDDLRTIEIRQQFQETSENFDVYLLNETAHLLNEQGTS